MVGEERGERRGEWRGGVEGKRVRRGSEIQSNCHIYLCIPSASVGGERESE